QMRVGVHAVAVGVLWIVVHVLRVARDHGLEELLDVGKERGLELVDEERARRVHRPEVHEPFPDAAPADEFHDAVRQVHHFDARIGLDDERLAVNRQTAGRRGRHRLNGVLADRSGRTLAHARLFACERSNNVTHNPRTEATLLYCARRSAETDATFEQFDAGPGGYAKLGAKPTRSRHCKRLATRQSCHWATGKTDAPQRSASQET